MDENISRVKAKGFRACLSLQADHKDNAWVSYHNWQVSRVDNTPHSFVTKGG
jgi:hypothetical protein